MKLGEIYNWLRETDEGRLEELWALADKVRHRNVGDEVHLRGLTEFSNYCVRRCAYCGLGSHNTDLKRYRMTAEEIFACARRICELGYGTIVLQSGQDIGISAQWFADVITEIKKATPLAVTLGLGERKAEELALWRAAGADRYLLRFETSDHSLYERVHPNLDGIKSDRIAILHQLRELGYEIGGGVMVGLPGQTYEILAGDIELFARLGLDMIGCGPYINNPRTPLGKIADELRAADDKQVPNDETTACKVIALARIVCPLANIPATTALATLDGQSGYELGLQRGANVIMPNITPAGYRALYEIYPDKAGVDQADDYHEFLKKRIAAIGRMVGTGRGDSLGYISRTEAPTCAT